MQYSLFSLCLLSLGIATASANSWNLSTTETGKANAYTHGFTMAITANTLTGDDKDAIPSQVVLNQITLLPRNTTNNYAGQPYGLVVVNRQGDAPYTVLGWSTNTFGQNSSTDIEYTFTMVAADGSSPLVIDKDTTYTYYAGNNDMITFLNNADNIAGKTVTFNISSGGTISQQFSHTDTDNDISITSGLTKAPVSTASYTDSQLQFIEETGLAPNATLNYSVLIKDVQLSSLPVPEPSCLFLSGIAALFTFRRNPNH